MRTVLKQFNNKIFRAKNNPDTKKRIVSIIQTRIQTNNQIIILNQVISINKAKSNKFSATKINQVISINKAKSNKFSTTKRTASQVYFSQTKNMTAIAKKFIIKKRI